MLHGSIIQFFVYHVLGAHPPDDTQRQLRDTRSERDRKVTEHLLQLPFSSNPYRDKKLAVTYSVSETLNTENSKSMPRPGQMQIVCRWTAFRLACPLVSHCRSSSWRERWRDSRMERKPEEERHLHIPYIVQVLISRIKRGFGKLSTSQTQHNKDIIPNQHRGYTHQTASGLR